MADKVRYYLEQSVPELQDLERKKLFDKKEITMIMRRRTDFEYRIVGRSSNSNIYLKYVEFEKNLERLRKKRFNRLKTTLKIDTKPSISDFASAKRIFFIFDRSIRKFPKDLKLWSSYLKYAKKNGSIKVIYRTYSKLLQLQPKNINAWLSAAYYEFEINKNAKGCRNLLQRSLRFNPESVELWLNYFKFEMNYLSKLLTRRKLLNLISEKQQLEDEQEGKQQPIEDGEDFDSNMISLLPQSDEQERNELNNLPEIDINMLGSIESNPVLKGQLITTIFDVCVNTLIKELNLNEKPRQEYNDKFFQIINQILKLIDSFPDLDRLLLCQHILNYLQNDNVLLHNDPRTYLLQLTLIIRYEADNLEFLQISIKNYFKLLKSLKEDTDLQINVQNLYIEYLTTHILSPLENKDDKKFKLIESLIKKCKLV